MKNSIQGVFVAVIASVAVSACSHQQVAPEPIVMAPVVEKPAVVIPAPRPYVKPAPMRPAPLPVTRPAPVVKPKPAPVIVKPRPVVVAPQPPVYRPPVKAKGHYRGSIPIASGLRQQYQQ